MALAGEKSYCMSGGWRSFFSRTRCRTCSRNCEGGTAPARLEEGVEPAGSGGGAAPAEPEGGTAPAGTEGGAAPAEPEGGATPEGTEGGAVPAGPWEELLQQGRTKEVLLEKRGCFGMSEGRTAQAGPKDKSVPARPEGGAAPASQREEMGQQLSLVIRMGNCSSRAGGRSCSSKV